MENPALLLIAIGAAAGYAAYQVYPSAGAVPALVVMFTVAWLLYRLSSGKRAWNTAAMMTNPVMTAIMFFLVGFSYFTFRAESMQESLVLAAGAGLLGGALGMLLFKYWNIGG